MNENTRGNSHEKCMKTHMNKCMKIGVKKLLLEVRENCCENVPEKNA